MIRIGARGETVTHVTFKCHGERRVGEPCGVIREGDVLGYFTFGLLLVPIIIITILIIIREKIIK